MTYDFNAFVDRSNTNAEKYKHRKALFGTDDIIPMWVADMDIASPHFVLDAIKERAEHAILGYEDRPSDGIAAQVSWLARRQQFVVEPEWILSTHSTVAAIHMAIQAFSDVNDEVIIMSPVYHAFARSVKQENRQLIDWPLDADNKGRYTFSLDKLKLLISKKTKILLLCSPHNPVGRVWDEKELHDLAEFCLNNEILIVSDEVHADLTYPPFTFKALASLGPSIANNCLTFQGPGKTFNLTGIGLSSIIISNPILRRNFTKVYRQFHPSYGNAFAHAAFKAAYRFGDEWLDGLIKHLSGNQALLTSLFEKYNNCIKYRSAEATFLAWLNCSELGMTDNQLNEFFINKAGLGLSAGPIFGVGGEQHMRLNFAVPAKTMHLVIQQLDHAIEKHL